MSATDWFQKMMKTAEEDLTLPESSQKADAKASGEEQPEEKAGGKTAFKEAALEQEEKTAAGEAKSDSGEKEAVKEADKEADIEDWADAAAKIASLEEEVTALKEEKTALEAELQAEKAERLAEKQEDAVKMELVKAGALDADYLCYKMGAEAEFDGEGNLIKADDLVREAKRRYPALFRAAFAADIDGVKPGDGGMGSGRRPDTGFLTYSQEQRLRERR